MSQIFGERGRILPVTLLAAVPNVVTQIRNQENDGYSATQLGMSHNKKATKGKPAYKFIKEFRSDGVELTHKVGDKLDVTQFEVGDKVTIVATSKGKGFAGTIKRYNFSRGPKSHGSMSYRRPGSIGSMYPQKVFKGKKMAGRMGKDRITLKKVEITAVDKDKNLIAVKGQVPGPKKGLVEIRG